MPLTKLSRFKRRLKPVFWKQMPWRSYFLFLVVVFFLFSSFGYIQDIMRMGSYSMIMLILYVLYSGFTAVGYVVSFTRTFKVLPFVVIFQFGFFFIPWDNIIQVGGEVDLSGRMMFDALGILASILLSYILLIFFISGEGLKQIRLRTEMDIAGEMHDVLVPELNYQDASLQIYGKSTPALEVGGDIIDLYKKDDVVTCYIADVSGHGISAGLLMGMFKSAIRVFLEKSYPLPQLAKEASTLLYGLKKRTMFITAAFLRVNAKNEVEFLTAGHPPILHYHANNGQITNLVRRQLPLASIKDPEFKSDHTKFSSGDIFVMLTDGTIELMDAKNQFYGIEKMESILARRSNQNPQYIYNKMIESLHKFGEQEDDQSLIIIKCV